MSGTILVFLDPENPQGRLADAEQAQISALDLGVTRGDGIFESLLVLNGKARKVTAHLNRLAHSAQILEIDPPTPQQWLAAIDTGLQAFDSPEAVVKLILTRGVEGGSPTAWVQISPRPAMLDAAEGISVLLLNRGYEAEIADQAPWLLLGAKTLSYAVNMAALRYAKNNTADDVIFTSSDGRVLEGPTSSVLVARRDAEGNKHLVTPLLESGILPGTTQAAIFDLAEEQGWALGYGPLVPSDLTNAAAVWLVSSIRGVAPVSHIEGTAIHMDPALTAELQEFFTAIL